MMRIIVLISPQKFALKTAKVHLSFLSYEYTKYAPQYLRILLFAKDFLRSVLQRKAKKAVVMMMLMQGFFSS